MINNYRNGIWYKKYDNIKKKDIKCKIIFKLFIDISIKKKNSKFFSKFSTAFWGGLKFSAWKGSPKNLFPQNSLNIAENKIAENVEETDKIILFFIKLKHKYIKKLELFNDIYKKGPG